MRLLHDLRADLDKPNTVHGDTPAGIAAHKGHTAIVQLLHDLGADVHRARNNGSRPIHSAAREGRDKTVLLLISLRADIEAMNGPIGSSLMLAAKFGHLGVVKVLIDAGAGNLGIAVTAATLRGRHEVVKYLRSIQEESQVAAIGEVD